MKIQHTKKLRNFHYQPDGKDKPEPALGTVLEVENLALAAVLISRGWGVEFVAPVQPDPPAEGEETDP